MIFGIQNCSTMTKAFQWLNKNEIDLPFHNYKTKGIDCTTLQRWCDLHEWDDLINKKGLTWKKLDSNIKENITDAQTAIKLMQTYPTLIRRPIIEMDKTLLVGFNEDIWAKYFKKKNA
ncbi:MAG: Spx/MgsR family RNA polymerase-binding regulatory protein [Proteobacteria bacterium]|nr:Spx/MgsR family RNA polymerase-binding regulatory protein [Pseudomonadota bacterium]MDE3207723.1 Spx/MgsR family RNA polymerase-binding regulatory protein [Pseudomonadota bacterium]